MLHLVPGIMHCGKCIEKLLKAEHVYGTSKTTRFTYYFYLDHSVSLHFALILIVLNLIQIGIDGDAASNFAAVTEQDIPFPGK